ncbi:MAG: exosortase/archaeosortase family protein, partial [Nitrososphaerota archaeon]|nr:exosortase/archaeosortase family protein [Nitrososphaerota archaeon]
YSYAAMALATGWVGVLLAVRPASLSFLWPYLLAFLLAVGTVGLLTTAFGDPLAVVVASISRVMTSALGLSVTWTSVYMSFTAAGGVPMSLYISQECSGMASMSIFLLLIVLMHLDVRPSLGVTAMFAVGGSVLFILLNSLRVVVLILGGIYYGEGVLWNLHGWLGYVLYVAGYMVILLLYIGRMKPANQAVLGAQVKATPS